jgi:hypothetical protein
MLLSPSIFGLLHASADSTCAAACWAHSRVFLREWMAVLAVSLIAIQTSKNRRTVAAQDVFTPGDLFEMCRVETLVISAQVVQVHAVGKISDPKSIGHAMDVFAPVSLSRTRTCVAICT